MPEISAVGVVGAGTMGHGIAQVAAQAGFATVLYDVARELAQQGLQRIGDNLDAGIAKGKVTAEQKAQALGRLRATGELRDLAGCQLVIEAAPEDLTIKQKLFHGLSELVAPLLRYSQSGELNFRVEDKDGAIRLIAEKYKKYQVDYLDGITVDAGDEGWWYNVRKSNTEPMLRLNLEARDPPLMAQKLDELKKILGEPVEGH